MVMGVIVVKIDLVVTIEQGTRQTKYASFVSSIAQDTNNYKRNMTFEGSILSGYYHKEAC